MTTVDLLNEATGEVTTVDLAETARELAEYELAKPVLGAALLLLRGEATAGDVKRQARLFLDALSEPCEFCGDGPCPHGCGEDS